MSRNETLSASITVPARETSALCKAMTDFANATHEATYQRARDVHKSIKTTSAAKYIEKLDTLRRDRDVVHDRQIDRSQPTTLAEDLALDVLGMLAHFDNLHAPTRADVAIHTPKATNRTDSWACHSPYGSECGTIRFHGGVLTMQADGNRAATDTLESGMGSLLVKHLKGIKWSRNSGGFIWSNDEYNEGPAGSAWGGGDGISEYFGPVGEAIYEQKYGWLPGKR